MKPLLRTIKITWRTNNMFSKQLDDLFVEAWKLMVELEDRFMYYSNDLVKAEEVILEATQLYFDVREDLQKNKDYDGFDEFSDKFKTSYVFMTSNYFMYKIESLKENK
jgi:hypothetical protein